MYKPAVAVLGTTCLLMGLFLRYTLAGNIKTKRTLEEVQNEIKEIKQQLAARSNSGSNITPVSREVPVRGSTNGSIACVRSSNEGGHGASSS